MNRITSSKLAVLVTIAIVMGASYAVAKPAGVPTSPDPHATAYLGVHIDDLTPQLASALRVNESSGAVIADLDQDGPACRAGLQENDVVVGFNGAKIGGAEQLGSLIHGLPPGKAVTLTIARGSTRKDVKVTLGEWPRMPHVVLHSQSYPVAPMALPGVVGDAEMPAFIAVTTHHGLQVEALSPQLADFFGVARGRGVLVRSVERGSPAESAGFKAGDVILRVNNEQVQDLADWRRGMRANASKISVNVLRDKHEQTLVIDVPAGGGSSQLMTPEIEQEMKAFHEELGRLSPQIAKRQKEELLAQLPDQKQMERMARQIGKSAQMTRKDMEKIQREIEKSAKPSQKELARMTRDMQKAMPSERELQQMQRQVQDSMKSWTPQLQQEMEQFRKQMEQQKFDLEQMLKQYEDRPQF